MSVLGVKPIGGLIAWSGRGAGRLIQVFLGVLAGRRATKGVFITTSRFSREARDFARDTSDGLVLIDGHELAELMMDYGVGVTVRETLRLVGIDSDYFEGE